MNISVLIVIAQQAKCEARVKPKDYLLESWSGVIEPVSAYIEAGGGPWPFREVEWVEINLIKEDYVGRLVPPRIIDKTDEVKQMLSDAGISYELADSVIRVYS